jgi:hypothetical protein
MKSDVNWGVITKVFIGLFFADLVAGFFAPDRLFVGLCLSFLMCLAIFTFMAYRRDARQFPHAGVALLAYFAFSQILAALLPTWMGSSSFLVVALDWLTSIVALVIGTSLGQLLSHTRRIRADA